MIEKLPYHTDLGITHIELMPVAEFSGSRGWGYDGVEDEAPFVPMAASMGGRDQLAVAAMAMHFCFGAAMGGLYGAWAKSAKVRTTRGALFGLGVWLGADEIAVPLLGLSASAYFRPREKRAQSIVAHLTFGMVAELSRAATAAKLRADSRIAPQAMTQ